MHHRFIFILLLLPCIANSMDLASSKKTVSNGMLLIPGQKVTWHDREYQVSERYVTGSHVTVIMTRPQHQFLGVALTLEQITRKYDCHNAQDAMPHPIETEGKTVLTDAGVLTAQTSAIVTAYCAYTYFQGL